MKKTFKVFAVLLAALLISSLSGCALMEWFQQLAGPQKQWFSYDYDYKVNEKDTIYLTCYFMYSDETYSSTKMKYKRTDPDNPEGAKLNNLPAGLSVVVKPRLKSKSSDSDELISVSSAELLKLVFGDDATQNSFTVFTLDSGKKTQIAGDEAETEGNLKEFIVNKYSWAVLYSCIGNALDSSAVPDPLKWDQANEDKEYTEASWENIQANFSIKKLLYTLAYNKLGKLLSEGK